MLNILKQARAGFSMIKPDEARKRGDQPVHIGLVAGTRAEYSEMERFLIPEGLDEPEREAARQMLHRADDASVPGTVDLVVYSHRVPRPENAFSFHPANTDALVNAVLEGHKQFDLSLARNFPPFRRAVITKIIHGTAFENALFAFATALPDVVPSLVELPWAVGEFASDLAFLTANQVRMAFLIASACGKPVGIGNQKAEVLSIVGSAFGWRAIARELVGKIPFGGGLIPKAAVAYAGTFAVGKGLAYYLSGNGRYTSKEREAIYRQALERGNSVAQSLAARK